MNHKNCLCQEHSLSNFVTRGIWWYIWGVPHYLFLTDSGFLTECEMWSKQWADERHINLMHLRAVEQSQQIFVFVWNADWKQPRGGSSCCWVTSGLLRICSKCKRNGIATIYVPSMSFEQSSYPNKRAVESKHCSAFAHTFTSRDTCVDDKSTCLAKPSLCNRLSLALLSFF